MYGADVKENMIDDAYNGKSISVKRRGIFYVQLLVNRYFKINE